MAFGRIIGRVDGQRNTLSSLGSAMIVAQALNLSFYPPFSVDEELGFLSLFFLSQILMNVYSISFGISSYFFCHQEEGDGWRRRRTECGM
jgi:hypothetical protein